MIPGIKGMKFHIEKKSVIAELHPEVAPTKIRDMRGSEVSIKWGCSLPKA